jgi:hypothetical protein
MSFSWSGDLPTFSRSIARVTTIAAMTAGIAQVNATYAPSAIVPPTDVTFHIQNMKQPATTTVIEKA